jgi:DNA-binding NtrC family response regulator
MAASLPKENPSDISHVQKTRQNSRERSGGGGGDLDYGLRRRRDGGARHQRGATDFVLKPWQNEKLLATLLAALQLRQSRLEVGHLRSRQQQLSSDLDQPFQDFIGSCPATQKVFTIIQKVAKTEANVLILGENGTGKELVARELHRQSLRAKEIFMSVDMGALSETLFESELFGHVKGVFTDAKEERAGRFEVASGGTLFLDEIGNLSLPLQAKLLTVLQHQPGRQRIGHDPRRALSSIGEIRSISDSG